MQQAPPPNPSFARISSFGRAGSAGTQAPTLILQLDDRYRIDPPIPMSVALQGLSRVAEATSSSHSFTGKGSGCGSGLLSLTVERALLEKGTPPLPGMVAQMFEAAPEAARGSLPSTSTSGADKQWQDTVINQFVDMGFTREQAAMGVAYCESLRASQTEVPQFASNLSQLLQMGFTFAKAAGALALCRNDAGKAADLLCSFAEPAHK